MKTRFGESDAASTVVDREVAPGKEGAPDSGKSGGPSGPRIRCPLCGWRPGKHDRWICKCRHIWNTFDTGGICPACLYQWMETGCHACKKMSPHSAWYAE